MQKSKKLIIIGDSSFAEIAYEYFTYDSPYEVCAFSVERSYLKKAELFGLPLVPFEDLQELYPPHEYEFFVAIVYTELNRLRTRLYQEVKTKGYTPASYISSKAFIWKNCKLGEHCFIFENNVVQPFVQIGNNVILWSGNHIGHHSHIEDNCFISSHVVISGHVLIGENCFLGVNSTIVNNVSIAKDNIIGASALVAKNVEEDKVVRGTASIPAGSAKRMSKVKESEACGKSLV
jgi:sugar O-acyltransferase (sialic acid O-acetyltransferase NeuD family)